MFSDNSPASEAHRINRFHVVSIMQPYLLPYLGYFQLISASDVFVLYDDVQYIKNGWINRNRILVQKQPSYFTLPVKRDGLETLIKDKEFADQFARETSRILRQLKENYGKAPYFEQTYHLVEKIFAQENRKLGGFIGNSIQWVCDYLGITTKIIRSSSLKLSENSSGEQRVIDIAKSLGGTCYINAIGGRSLYHRHTFEAGGMQLYFLKCLTVPYPQATREFVPFLSILDVMMWNSPDTIQSLLSAYELEAPVL